MDTASHLLLQLNILYTAVIHSNNCSFTYENMYIPIRKRAEIYRGNKVKRESILSLELGQINQIQTGV